MVSPRSLADALRQRDDASLARLLQRRPDLLHPVPSDITALTTRATTGPSMSRCLDGLDALSLHVLATAARLTPTDPAPDSEIVTAAALAVSPESVDACRMALDDLIDLALVWGEPTARRAVHSVRDLVAHASVPPWPRPVPVAAAAHDPHGIDAQAALHGRDALTHVRDLLDDWSLNPPAILRSGGLSLRDFATARGRLHADWRRTSLVIEVAHASRLVADDHEEAPHWVPTDHYDTWLAKDPAEQWVELVTAWLALARLPSLADEKTQVLSTDRDRGAIPLLRRQVLELLGEMGPGESLEADVALRVLDDRQPRRSGELRNLAVEATLLEAAELGITAAGALSTAGRILLAPVDAGAAAKRAHAHDIAAALTSALPADVDHVLIQADLTVVAPGPLVAHVARSMRMVADVESRGHATVYRISDDSIRRAFDAGWDAASIHALFDEISSTSVPQPLAYLIDDVARRHGAARVGNALGYIRCDNPETLSAMVGDRRLRALGLSRIADTVVVSQAPASELITALRAAGYAPAAESPDGTVVIRRPEDRRTAMPRAQAVTSRRQPEDALIAAAIRSLRAGDRARNDPRGTTIVGPASSQSMPSLSTSAIVASLRQALAENRPVWIGYADTDGTVTQQIVDPIRIGAGVLTAFDHRVEQVRSFAVSRVTGIAELEDA